MEVGVDAGLVIGEGVALQMQTIPLLGQSTMCTVQKLVALVPSQSVENSTNALTVTHAHNDTVPDMNQKTRKSEHLKSHNKTSNLII